GWSKPCKKPGSVRPNRGVGMRLLLKYLLGFACLVLLCGGRASAQDDDLLDLDLEQLMNLDVIQVTIPGAHWHWEDDWMVGYQYTLSHYKGHQSGTNKVSDQEVLAQFPITHERMTMHMHMLMFMYGNSDELTIMAMVPWMEMD